MAGVAFILHFIIKNGKMAQKDWNCTVLRAAMGIEPDNGYIQNPKVSEKLITDVVDAAIANDIYVIIDWHSHNLQLKEAEIFFDKMSKNMDNILMSFMR